jgi:hypothetical protein
MFRPLGHLQVGSRIFGGKTLVQHLVLHINNNDEGGGGGGGENEISFYK